MLRFLMFVPLVGLILWAAVEDVRARRVPNWITFTLIACGLLKGFFITGGVTPLQSLQGLACGFAIALALHALGGTGLGDVKLIAGIGAWVGPAAILLVLAAAAVVGMGIAIVQSASQGRLVPLLRDSLLLGFEFMRAPRAGMVKTPVDPATGRPDRQRTLPFGVAVVAATLCVLAVSISKGGWVR